MLFYIERICFCSQRKLCFILTKHLEIKLHFIYCNQTDNNCQILMSLLLSTEGMHWGLPEVNFCPCFCTDVYPQQTANLAWIKSWLSSTLCPAQKTAVKSRTRKPVQVSMCWVRTVITGWSCDERN